MNLDFRVSTFWLQIVYFGQHFGVLVADSGQIQKLNILIPPKTCKCHRQPIDPCQFRWSWVTLKGGTQEEHVGREYF